MTIKAADILPMSDEDFMNLDHGNLANDETTSTVTETTDGDLPTAAADVAQEDATPSEQVAEDNAGELVDPDPKSAELPDPVDPPAKLVDPAAPVSPDNPASVGSVDAPVVEQVNYEEAYKEIMKPFKANGKMIELKDVNEATKLMQMGANYTRKMQELQPHRKMLMMLENNGLLDEGKLSYLIDLDKKNPDAIMKLVKDAGIDPLDIDTESSSTYQAGNHRVADEEVQFMSVLEDLKSQPEGHTTLKRINTEWDQASKEVLWNQPQIMTVMHQQIEGGIYDLIETEISRRKTLGLVSPDTPFLQAYKLVGDEMHAAGAFGAPVQTTAQRPAPIATTVAAVRPPVANGAKASAASPTRSTPRTVGKTLNPLSMSDEEFLRQMQNRV